MQRPGGADSPMPEERCRRGRPCCADTGHGEHKSQRRDAPAANVKPNALHQAVTRSQFLTRNHTNTSGRGEAILETENKTTNTKNLDALY